LALSLLRTIVFQLKFELSEILPLHERERFTYGMRVVAVAAWVLPVVLSLEGIIEFASSSAADTTNTITLRKCIDFMGGYAGSWFAKDTMFKDVKWPDRVRNIFTVFDTRARLSTGLKFRSSEYSIELDRLTAVQWMWKSLMRCQS